MFLLFRYAALLSCKIQFATNPNIFEVIY